MFWVNVAFRVSYLAINWLHKILKNCLIAYQRWNLQKLGIGQKPIYRPVVCNELSMQPILMATFSARHRKWTEFLDLPLPVQILPCWGSQGASSLAAIGLALVHFSELIASWKAIQNERQYIHLTVHVISIYAHPNSSAPDDRGSINLVHGKLFYCCIHLFMRMPRQLLTTGTKSMWRPGPFYRRLDCTQARPLAFSFRSETDAAWKWCAAGRRAAPARTHVRNLKMADYRAPWCTHRSITLERSLFQKIGSI